MSCHSRVPSSRTRSPITAATRRPSPRHECARNPQCSRFHKAATGPCGDAAVLRRNERTTAGPGVAMARMNNTFDAEADYMRLCVDFANGVDARDYSRVIELFTP